MNEIRNDYFEFPGCHIVETDAFKPEMVTWVLDGTYVLKKHATYTFRNDGERFYWLFAFQDENDAIEFKLRFG